MKRRIVVSVSTNIVGSETSQTLEIESDMTEDEIDDLARDTMFEMIEWGWKESGNA